MKGASSWIAVTPAICTSQTHVSNNRTDRCLYTWTPPDGQYRNQTDSAIGSRRWESCIVTAKTRPETDCGTDHELLTSNVTEKLKRRTKTIIVPTCSINNIPDGAEAHNKIILTVILNWPRTRTTLDWHCKCYYGRIWKDNANNLKERKSKMDGQKNHYNLLKIGKR